MWAECRQALHQRGTETITRGVQRLHEDEGDEAAVEEAQGCDDGDGDDDCNSDDLPDIRPLGRRATKGGATARKGPAAKSRRSKKMDDDRGRSDGEGGRNFWSVGDTIALVRARRDQDLYFAGMGTSFARMKTREWKWEDVRARLQSMGVTRDVVDCGKKWDNLMQQFKKVHKFQNLSGGKDYFKLASKDRRSEGFSFVMDRSVYDEMEAMTKGDHTIHPKNLADTGATGGVQMPAGAGAAGDTMATEAQSHYEVARFFAVVVGLVCLRRRRFFAVDLFDLLLAVEPSRRGSVSLLEWSGVHQSPRSSSRRGAVHVGFVSFTCGTSSVSSSIVALALRRSPSRRGYVSPLRRSAVASQRSSSRRGEVFAGFISFSRSRRRGRGVHGKGEDELLPKAAKALVRRRREQRRGHKRSLTEAGNMSMRSGARGKKRENIPANSQGRERGRRHVPKAKRLRSEEASASLPHRRGRSWTAANEEEDDDVFTTEEEAVEENVAAPPGSTLQRSCDQSGARRLATPPPEAQQVRAHNTQKAKEVVVDVGAAVSSSNVGVVARAREEVPVVEREAARVDNKGEREDEDPLLSRVRRGGMARDLADRARLWVDDKAFWTTRERRRLSVVMPKSSTTLTRIADPPQLHEAIAHATAAENIALHVLHGWVFKSGNRPRGFNVAFQYALELVATDIVRVMWNGEEWSNVVSAPVCAHTIDLNMDLPLWFAGTNIEGRPEDDDMAAHQESTVICIAHAFRATVQMGGIVDGDFISHERLCRIADCFRLLLAACMWLMRMAGDAARSHYEAFYFAKLVAKPTLVASMHRAFDHRQSIIRATNAVTERLGKANATLGEYPKYIPDWASCGIVFGQDASITGPEDAKRRDWLGFSPLEDEDDDDGKEDA
ncbi:hypothetical protein CBR_g26191 [Chara braunii]|uniref:Myb/SANT-like DNA-binding domain-containing protein n=1 Tax=Chara braunii TaxID=69332 RepID=A0A388L782_CHABU|nr:hypothetical protein CBR_g26191 [Chara braunii]|eukprot:GBG78156.1 hypothetical protein CBR_g26191 [Chara braunii]